MEKIAENMYIYQLPFDINRELCRLLDMDDIWKELAGEQMMYSPFQIIEIEQTAKRQSNSPTQQLFTRWGQLNHNVGELFILLYKMKHIPALRCLVPVVDERFHKLLAKLDSKNGTKEQRQRSNDVNGNIRNSPKQISGQSLSIPLPVLLLQMQAGWRAQYGMLIHGQTLLPIFRRYPLAGSYCIHGHDRRDNILPPAPHALQGSKSAAISNGHSTQTDSSLDSRDSVQCTKTKSVDDEIAKKVSLIPKMSYDELAVATDNWNEKNLLGKGGFGQVFKGELQHLPVAVKKLKDNDKLNQELIREMCLNQYRHDNILPLYGYSIGGTEACLVYQLMTGGSLQQRIHRDKAKYPPLTWPQRYRIAHGVARGLHYLHNADKNNPLIHGDIKPANILLDQCLMPKIGDFGLARKGPYGDDKTHLKVSRVIGTQFYLPKEYRQSFVLSRALDTYSYGVVALEMATARQPARKRRDADAYVHLTTDIHQATKDQLFDLASLEDPDIINTPLSHPALCIELISIGLECTRDRRQDRPEMLDVYKRLQALEFPDKHYS